MVIFEHGLSLLILSFFGSKLAKQKFLDFIHMFSGYNTTSPFFNEGKIFLQDNANPENITSASDNIIIALALKEPA